MSEPVLAAGTVCWRRVQLPDGGEEIMVLLVHRTKQRDVSLPKGKLDPGESMPQAAVRETREETGIAVSLGANLGTINYELPGGGAKTVQYWAAEATEAAIQASTFVPNKEIAALEWQPVKKVAKRLSYDADRELFSVFERLVERDAIDTFSVILLRHAKAVPRSEAHTKDRLRLLTDTGEEQAENLVPTLAAFGPLRLLSSSAERCMRTVTPIAHHLHKAVRVYEGLTQDAWEKGATEQLRRLVGKVIRRGKNTVLCTHQPLLPEVARELSLATGSLPGAYLRKATQLPPGGLSVFHFSKRHPGAGILSVEVYPFEH